MEDTKNIAVEDGAEDTLDLSHLSEESRYAVGQRRSETRGMTDEERISNLLGLEDDW